MRTFSTNHMSFDDVKLTFDDISTDSSTQHYVHKFDHSKTNSISKIMLIGPGYQFQITFCVLSSSSSIFGPFSMDSKAD